MACIRYLQCKAVNGITCSNRVNNVNRLAKRFTWQRRKSWGNFGLFAFWQDHLLLIFTACLEKPWVVRLVATLKIVLLLACRQPIMKGATHRGWFLVRKRSCFYYLMTNIYCVVLGWFHLHSRYVVQILAHPHFWFWFKKVILAINLFHLQFRQFIFQFIQILIQ